jgi:ubiquinone/menaquinone biosynthesis C-methylase UbiE
MFLNPFRRRDDPFALLVGMTGVKLGDRVVQIGCAHGGRLAAVAAKVGLSGHAVAVVPDEESAVRARKGAADAGVLVEIEIAPLSALPAERDAFDLAIVDNTGALLTRLQPAEQTALAVEIARVLRPAGRLMVVGATPQGGLAAMLSRGETGPPFDPEPPLKAGGFKSVRTLAAREGLVFVEGIKPRST